MNVSAVNFDDPNTQAAVLLATFFAMAIATLFFVGCVFGLLPGSCCPQPQRRRRRDKQPEQESKSACELWCEVQCLRCCGRCCDRNRLMEQREILLEEKQ